MAEAPKVSNQSVEPEAQPPSDVSSEQRPGLLARLDRRVSRIPSGVRYAIPFAVLIVGGSIQTVFWFWNADDATKQVMSCWYILPGIPFLLLLWWLFLSGFRWKTRLAGVGVLGVAAIAFFATFRVKEFSGDMVPRFESRWQRSAEQKSADYWKGTRIVEGNSLDASAAAALTAAPTDWPQFEGPDRDGIAHGVRMRTDWDRQPPRLLWRHPVGAAWSSFAVVGKYAFTQEQHDQDEAVVCYDADNGKLLWDHIDPKQRFYAALAGLGPRGTPTVSGSRVYTFGAYGILNCFEPRTGKLLWSRNTLEDAGVEVLRFGMSSSPLVYDNLVVVHPGGPRMMMQGKRSSGKALIAYDRVSGKQVWAAGDYQAAYASPILATIGGVRQVVLFDGLGGAGHDAATGKELWRSPEWTNEFHNNIAQPIVEPGGSVFLSSGYGTGCILLDVTHQGSTWTTSTRWTSPNKFKLKFNSAVRRGGEVYGLDEGILACLDLATGRELWKKGRYKYGQVLLLEDLLFVISEDGDAVLVDVSREGCREVAKFHALEGKTWNLPALSRGRLYLRNAEEAACYDVGSLETASR